ncbi:MAG: hypothetical protein JWL76_2119 [Thermoleophilia bacterium]|nr:hypothetical protein [Thermoleophilia bacterium]
MAASPSRHRRDVHGELTQDELLELLIWSRRENSLRLAADTVHAAALDDAIEALQSGKPIRGTDDEREPIDG